MLVKPLERSPGLLISLALATVVITALLPARVRAEPSAFDLDGRLGGSRASFERIYGSSTQSGIDRGFVIDGYGLVQVQFGGKAEDGPAIVITLRSPRPDDLAATKRSKADWSFDEADESIAPFLPQDVVLGDPEQIGGQSATRACQSETLAGAFGQIESVEGNCRVSYVTPTAETVSYVVLALTADGGSPEAMSTPIDTCAGMTAWIQATGDRLAQANAELDAISALANDDPDIPDRLNSAAQTLNQLTDEQREAPAPDSAATANYYFIRGLKGYADALTGAYEAVTKNDRQLATEAAETYAEAGHSISSGIDEMSAAAADCGLTLGTPEATS